MRKEQLKKTGKCDTPEEKKEKSMDELFKDLKQRAKLHSQPPPAAKVNIAHLGRQSSNQMMYDAQRCFQIQYDFEGLSQAIHAER